MGEEWAWVPSGKEALLTTLAEVGSVLGSVGGLSITVGSGGERGRVL